MGGQLFNSGNSSGFQYEKQKFYTQEKNDSNIVKKQKDEDLIIEENTIYEIDRECYERLKRQKKRKD